MTIEFWLGVYLGGYGIYLMKLRASGELSLLSATVLLLWPPLITVIMIIDVLHFLIKNFKTKMPRTRRWNLSGWYKDRYG